MELTYIRDATQIGSKHDFSAGLIIGGKDFSVEQGHIGKMNILICTPGVEGGLRRVKMREFATGLYRVNGNSISMRLVSMPAVLIPRTVPKNIPSRCLVFVKYLVIPFGSVP